MSDRAIDALADQRIKRGADGQRQSAAKGEIGEGQPDDNVDRPCMQAPVEEGQRHRLARRFRRAALPYRRTCIMLDGFRDTEEDEADAHAGAEQHRKPRDIAIVRLAFVRSQLDVAVPAEHQIDDKHQKTGHRRDIEPAEIADDHRLYLVEDKPRLLRQERAEQRESKDQPR